MSSREDHSRDHRRTHRHSSPRSRSRSPYKAPRDKHRYRSRSRSPHDAPDKKRRRKKSSVPPKPVILPLKAKPLQKHDFRLYLPLLELYLDVQKQIDATELDERELKGRWKSFLKKWNAGELAEGWYDPETKSKADTNAIPQGEARDRRPPSRPKSGGDGAERDDGDEDDDDDYGPSAPGHGPSGRRAGPSIPSFQDLKLRDEERQEDLQAARADLAFERKYDRKVQRERLDELVPRADPGSRERQLEKKREVTAAHARFREAKSPGAEEVVGEDLLGDDGIDSFKRKRMEEQKKMSERQLQKEEALRARAAEREERKRALQEKEDRTMDMLKTLAKQRFG